MSEQRQTRVVRNRDIPLLQEVGYIMDDIEALEKRRKWERDRMFHITQQLSDSPVSGNAPRGLDEVFAAISQLEEEHRRLVRQYIGKIDTASKLILAIPSRQMQRFVRMLYMDHETDKNVREKLKMSRWAFENARKAVEQAEDMQSVKWSDRYTESV